MNFIPFLLVTSDLLSSFLLTRGSLAGEDSIIHCPTCLYTSNEECATMFTEPLKFDVQQINPSNQASSVSFKAISNGDVMELVLYRSDRQLQSIKLTKYLKSHQLDSINPWDDLIKMKIARISIDKSLQLSDSDKFTKDAMSERWNIPVEEVIREVDVTEAKEGDLCLKCAQNNQESRLTLKKGIELGHTFFLGDKYSSTFKALYQRNPAQMGCYGLGVSRMIAAVAEQFHDENGIMWPWSIAPFKICILGIPKSTTEDFLIDEAKNLAQYLSKECPLLNHEIVIDDRFNLSIGTRMADAKLVGYPCLVVLGKEWRQRKRVEVLLRSGQTDIVEAENLPLLIKKMSLF